MMDYSFYGRLVDGIRLQSFFLMLIVGCVIAQPAPPLSRPGDVVGKAVIGYQGWFAAPKDGSPINAWVHWIKDGLEPRTQPLRPGMVKFDLYPDTREYTKLYQTQLGVYGNRQIGGLFSSWDQETVSLHFKWMQQYGIDCVAFQRFGLARSSDVIARQQDGVIQKVMNASQTYQRKWYVAWDISGWNNQTYSTDLLTDLNYLNQRIGVFNHPYYARQNGKLVISLWGFGFYDREGRPTNPDTAIDLINRLKTMGFYVIGGVPSAWRFTGQNSLATFQRVYSVFHMLQPWHVGAYTTPENALAYQNILSGDFNVTKARGQDYQPVVFPGFSWSNWHTEPQSVRNQIPRMAGKFFWAQFFNLRKLGIQNCMVAMFDEYDEGTAIAKAAEDKSMVPVNQWFLTLDADGIHVSSDFYLRVYNDGTKMMKGITSMQQQCPTSYTPSASQQLLQTLTSMNPSQAPLLNTIFPLFI
ncbi:uncharacterized protein LOC116348015 [Contarinia nasturtii]|uniref:uncharacterized protein LOC116348015 n=1 Tax=Contarinia nasturtii TaxID=265458 RepID=UPI0012D4975A|nr:uncharacterized protein LOC116348015 [Contarinia nasturtii]